MQGLLVFVPCGQGKVWKPGAEDREYPEEMETYVDTREASTGGQSMTPRRRGTLARLVLRRMAEVFAGIVSTVDTTLRTPRCPRNSRPRRAGFSTIILRAGAWPENSCRYQWMLLALQWGQVT